MLKTPPGVSNLSVKKTGKALFPGKLSPIYTYHSHKSAPPGNGNAASNAKPSFFARGNERKPSPQEKTHKQRND